MSRCKYITKISLICTCKYCISQHPFLSEVSFADLALIHQWRCVHDTDEGYLTLAFSASDKEPPNDGRTCCADDTGESLV